MVEEILQHQAEQRLASVVATAAVPSQTFPLAGGGTRNFTTFCVAGSGVIAGLVFADADGTLVIEQAINGTTFDLATTIPVTANVPAVVEVPVYGVQARCRYTNGANPQTLFRANIVSRPISGGPAGGGTGGGGTSSAGLVMVNTSAPLGAGATFTGTAFALGATAVGQRYSGYDIIRGLAQSDVAGTVRVWQATAVADLVAPFTNCAGTDFAVPAGGLGLIFTLAAPGPFALLQLVNGGAPQTRFRFYASAIT